MDWALAIEKNREALRRILAMLVAMVAAANGGSAGGQFFTQKGSDASGQAHAEKSKPTPAPTLPRHLHRFVLRLLRPAEAATRRLIIVAARGLVVELVPAAPARRQAETGPQPKQRLRHRCGDPARSAAGMGPGAGPEALVHSLVSAVRPAQTVWRPPPVCETARRAAHQVLRRPAVSASSNRRARRIRCRHPPTICSMRAVCIAVSKRWPRHWTTCRGRQNASHAGRRVSRPLFHRKGLAPTPDNRGIYPHP